MAISAAHLPGQARRMYLRAKLLFADVRELDSLSGLACAAYCSNGAHRTHLRLARCIRRGGLRQLEPRFSFLLGGADTTCKLAWEIAILWKDAVSVFVRRRYRRQSSVRKGLVKSEEPGQCTSLMKLSSFSNFAKALPVNVLPHSPRAV